MEFSIRPYQETDAEAVKKCMAELNAFESRFDRDYLPASESVDESFAYALKCREEGGEILVAEVTSEGKSAVAGFAALELQNKNDEMFVGTVPAVFIFAMFVHEAERSHGIGKALLDASAAFARIKGIAYLTLDVYAENSTARDLYGREGFTASEIYMVKDLHARS